MQNVSTWELLCPLAFVNALTSWKLTGLDPGPHLLATNNTGIFPRQFLRRGIGVAGIHVSCSVSVLDEVVESLDKGSKSHEEVPHNVDGDAVEGHEYHEETDVHNRLDEI